MEVDNEHSYEFSTLKCQWSLTDSSTITVHLKVAFCDEAADDQARMALQVTAIVDDIVGDSVVYRGFVIGKKAADQCLDSGIRHDGDESAAVRVWLRNARVALIGSDEKPTTEYVYHLRRENDDNDRLLTLAWKIKLRLNALATLGMVQMTEVTPRVNTTTVSLTCTSFITPLIRILSTERKRQKLSDLAAADRERCLLEDNRRLLDELRLMADGQRLENQRLMARFLEVLNTKKRRIINLQQELDKLKLEQEILQPVTIVAEQKKAIAQQRHGRGTCHGRPGPIKKIKRSTTHSKDMKKLCASSSEDKNATQRHINSSVQWPELEEINELNCDNISGNLVVDTKKTPMSTSIPVSLNVSPILPVSTVENVSVDPRYFTDTQIDSPNSSPTWLQQPLTDSPSPRLQPSINQHDEHQLPKKKSVLDDLWSGIV